MWRAFFFAIGTTLILLGGQCLIVDHAIVANGTRVPAFVAKLLQNKTANGQNQGGHLGQPQIGANQSQAIQNSQFQQASFPNNFSPNFPQSGNNGSRFGPSRFADSQFNNSPVAPRANYYGGIPTGVGSQGQQNPQFMNAGYDRSPIGTGAGFGGQNGAAMGQSQGGTVSLGTGPSRLLKPKDWMPWALIAVGTLVVLYTNSTGRRFGAE